MNNDNDNPNIDKKLNNDFTNRSNNVFLNKNNNDYPNVFNPYDQINDKSNISHISNISTNQLALKQSTSIQNIQLEKINSVNKLNNFNEKPEKNINNLNKLEYSQISNNNIDSSRFTNIPLNDLSAPIPNMYEHSNIKNKNNHNNLPHSSTFINKTATNSNFNQKLGRNVTGIPHSATIKATQNNQNLEGEITALSPLEKEQDHYVEKLNRKISNCYYIFHLIILIILIPTFYLIYQASYQLNRSELSYFAKISTNWFTNPISKLSLDCSNKESLINDWWPGTNYGCLCSGIVMAGKCSRRSFCTNIDITPPKKYLFWKGIKICVERLDISYLDMTLVKNSNACPIGTQNCGKIDTQGNYFCLDKNIQCPINNIIKNPSSTEIDKKSNDFIVSMGDSTFLFGRDGLESNVYIQFKVAYNQPCMNPFYENLNFQVYPLNYFFQRQTCYRFADYSDQSIIIYDTNYILIDNYYGENLIIENGINSTLASLPLFNPKEFQRNVYLYAKNYFGLKIDCFYRIKNNQLIVDLASDFIQIRNLDDLSGTFITSLILQLILIIIMIFKVCCFRATVNRRRSQRPVRFHTGHIFTYFILFGIMCLCYFFFIGIISASSSNLLLSDSFNYVFSSSACVDDYTVDLYWKFIPSIHKARNYLKTSIFLVSLMLISQLIFFIYSGCKINDPDFYFKQK